MTVVSNIFLINLTKGCYGKNIKVIFKKEETEENNNKNKLKKNVYILQCLFKKSDLG